MSVVLPEPLSPTSARLSSGPEVQVTSSTAAASAARVGERHALEPHAVAADRPGWRCRRRASRLPRNRRGSTGTGCPRTCRRSPRGSPRRRLALLEDQQVHRHRAERDVAGDGRHDDPARRRRTTRRSTRARAKPQPPRRMVRLRSSPYSRWKISLYRPTSIGPDAEELHLLGVVLAGHHGLEVHLLAGLGRAPAEQPERLAGEPGLGDERRHREHQDHDRQRRKRDRRCRSSRATWCSAAARTSAGPGSAAETTLPAAPASSGRRTRSPRSGRARGSSAFSRIITFTRCPSWARSSDWQAEMPRWQAATAITTRASKARRRRTPGMSGRSALIAATTASTMSWPIHAIRAGRMPAHSVSTASESVRLRLVVHTSSRARRL